MNPDLLPVVLGANRVLLYAGYVALAGTLTFWLLVWPEGRQDRRLVGLTVVGTAATALASAAGPLLRVVWGGEGWGDVLTPVSAAALMVRMAALAAAAFFLVDIVRHPITGRRRLLPAAIVLVIGASMVASSNAVGDPWQTAKIIATAGHVVATAAWLGGLLALAAVIIPKENLDALDLLIPRFSKVAFVSVIVLLVTGTVHALAVAGGVGPLVESRYGLYFGIKVVVFALMLLLGNHGRGYAERAAERAKEASTAELRRSHGVQALAVVMGSELTVALVILVATSLLVGAAPH